LNPWGLPLESSLRLVGDEDVSGALVIDIVIDQTQYSCYLVYLLYARSCWHPADVCGTKYHTEQSATTHA